MSGRGTVTAGHASQFSDANEMLRFRARRGVVTMCVGGGQGPAGLFEAWS